MWNHAVKFAGQLDQAFSVGKRVFGALHPMIEDLGGSKVNRAVMQGISRVDQAREQAMGMQSNVMTQMQRLRKAVPEIDI